MPFLKTLFLTPLSSVKPATNVADLDASRRASRAAEAAGVEAKVVEAMMAWAGTRDMLQVANSDKGLQPP